MTLASKKRAFLLAVVAFFWCAPALAAAEPHWGFDIDLALRAASHVERWDDGEPVHQVAGRIEGRGLAGGRVLGVAAAVDVELGFEVPAGFVYGFHLSPLGGSLRFGGRNWLGVTAGAGFGGVIDRLHIAWEIPVEAFLELDLGPWVRARALARATWTPGTESREGGAIDVGFCDEAEASFGLAIGKRQSEYGFGWSDGTYVGVFVREQAGERLYGLVLSLAINGASR